MSQMPQQPTNFAMVSRINTIAGKPYGNPNEFHLPEFVERLRNQSRLIQSELNETINKGIQKLEELIAAGVTEGDDFNKAVLEVRDGTMDILFTGYGLGHLAGLNVDQDFNEVCRSNMSKFDLTPENAELTRQKYAEKGVETYILQTEIYGTTYFITRSSKDQEVPTADGTERIPAHKWLKSVNFQEPQYMPVLTQYAEYETRKKEYEYGLRVQNCLDELNTVLVDYHTEGATQDQPVDRYAGLTQTSNLAEVAPVADWVAGVKATFFAEGEKPSMLEWTAFATTCGNIGVNVEYRPVFTPTGVEATMWRIVTAIGYIDLYPADDEFYEAQAQPAVAVSEETALETAAPQFDVDVDPAKAE